MNVLTPLRELGSWIQFLPISKKDYFKHLLLIIDCIFILFRVSYESFLSININLWLFIFDIVTYLFWLIDISYRSGIKKDRLAYFKNRVYYILGLFPFPIFRLFLLISTIKQIIIIYKYIKRGEKDKSIFIDKELNFTFFDFFIDTISDAIFLRSLERVDEVMSRLEYDKISKKIISNHKENLRTVVRTSMSSKTAIGRLDSFPLFHGIADQMSEDVTGMMIEAMQNKVMGDLLRELNIHILNEMKRHVMELDLDRIVESNEIS